MKASAVTRILSNISEDAMRINERSRKNGKESDVIYNLTISTENRQFEYEMTEDSNWQIEDDTLLLETNKGTQWIDIDKIVSIEI